MSVLLYSCNIVVGRSELHWICMRRIEVYWRLTIGGAYLDCLEGAFHQSLERHNLQGLYGKFCDNTVKMVKKMQNIQISNIYSK